MSYRATVEAHRRLAWIRERHPFAPCRVPAASTQPVVPLVRLPPEVARHDRVVATAPGLPAPPSSPPFRRCQLILIADEAERIRPWPYNMLTSRDNLACWEGPRVVADHVCGGGRRVVRKALAE